MRLVLDQGVPRDAASLLCELGYDCTYVSADRLGVPLLLHDFITVPDGIGTLGLPPESVMHQNSLQVINAEQYIFSSDGDFALVRNMLRTNPELRNGPRYGMA